MHTPLCPGLYGNIETIPLPRPGSRRPITADPDYDVGRLNSGQALWVALNEPYSVTFEVAGKDSITFQLTAGVRRFIAAEDYTAVKFTCTSVGFCWTEDLIAWHAGAR
jgi:hypothetical protein